MAHFAYSTPHTNTYKHTALSNSAAGREQLQPEGTTAPENNEDKCDANDLEVAEISLSNGDNRQLEEQLSEELCFKKQKVSWTTQPQAHVAFGRPI